MSGFLAFVNLDGRPPPTDTINRMARSMTRWGKEGGNVYVNGAVAFGHRPLPAAAEPGRKSQPLADGHLILTCDARLDNRDELTAQLRINGAQRPSDAQLLLCAYRKWGEECVSRFSGDFAFALWDSLRQVLFCGRDHVGVRPLYWALAGSAVAVSSDVATVLASGLVSGKPDAFWISAQLASLHDAPARTPYSGTSVLPAGHTLTVSARGQRVRRYWDPRELEVLPGRPLPEWVEGLRYHLVQAVSSRLPTNGRPGASLSGGVDSTSVACLGRQLSSGDAPFPVFAFHGSSPDADERRYREATARIPGFEFHELNCDGTDPFSALQDYSARHPVPDYFPGLNLQSALYARASENGVRVYLEGFGGDQVLSLGLGRLNELFFTGHWLHAAREARAVRRHGLPVSLNLKQMLWHRLPLAVHHAYRRVRHRPLDGYGPAELISLPLATRTNLPARIRESRQLFSVHSSHRYDCEQILDPRIQVFLQATHVVASMHGIEVTYPFLDRRLVEYCLTMPPTTKLQDGWTRFAHRIAMDGILPPEVQWRGTKSRPLVTTANQTSLPLHRLLEVAGAADPSAGQYLNVPDTSTAFSRYQAMPTFPNLAQIFPSVALAHWLAERYNPWSSSARDTTPPCAYPALHRRSMVST